jgi:arylsulfatase A-like enzyme
LSGKKGSLWEGGIRVPTIIEWPARIKSPAQTSIPFGTVDIYPTLSDIVGAKVAQRLLDGISLLPLLEGRMTDRPKPLGFWVYPQRGRPVRSAQLLKELAREQAGGAPGTAPKDDPGKITRQYPDDVLPGHAAWIDNNYKLHRIPGKTGEVRYTLFDLAGDAQEKNNLAELQPRRLDRMKAGLELWQKSVIKSLNGEDYPSR